MIETKITLTIKHTRPLPDLCDLVAGRAYTLQHVEDVTAEVVGQAEAVPSTHVLVPVEPTKAMILAGSADLLLGDCIGTIIRASECYRAMIAAAPKPHQPPKPSPNEWVLE